MDISYAFIAIAAIAAVLLFLLLKTYNGLIKMRNAVQSGWSDIDVQLTRRHDLVPNLVEAVKGYMTHERETLEAVTRARTEAVSAHRRSVAGYASHGGDGAYRSGGQSVCHGGAISGAEGFATIFAFAGADHVHGKPDCICAAALQRVCAEVQHGAGGVSAQPDCGTDGIYTRRRCLRRMRATRRMCKSEFSRRFSLMSADKRTDEF